MDAIDKTKLEPWHLRFGRAKFLRPRLLIFMVCAYVIIYSIVVALMFVKGWIVPYLPWIPKPYVSPDPSPVATAFYCANFMLGFMVIAVPVIYIAGPERQIRPLWPRKRT